MSVPKPADPSALDNACTVIFDNTLYSYSDKGFLALPLEENAEWKTLKTDGAVKVTGPSCAIRTKGGASLLVVGGYSDDKSHSGLQQYSFASGTWTPLKPQSDDFQNRRGHSVVYNQATDTIVVFSGLRSDDPAAPPGASTQSYKFSFDTLRIDSTTPPQISGSPPTDNAAAVKPMLFPWTGADVALISGPRDGGNIWLLNADVDGVGRNSIWRNVGSVKDSWPSDAAGISGMLVAGADNSFNLLKFDLGRSPNELTRIPIAEKKWGATAVTKRSVDFGTDNWPQYNKTNAPDATRNGYSVAQGADGMIVISGGNAQDPVAIFNAKKNSWVKAADMLGDPKQKILATSTTTSTTTSTSTTISSTFTTSISTTTSTTTTATPTVTSPAATPDKHGPSSNAILGITLGTIAAFLAILLVILLLLKRRKRRVNPNQGGVLNPDEKDTVAFAKSTQPSASPAHYRGHNPTLSTESYSSVAILMGRMGPQKQAGANGKTSRASTRSSISSLHKQFKSTISKPIPQPSNNPMLQAQDERGVAFDPSVNEPQPRNGPMPAQDGTRRSSGWNKYWSGGSALQILGYGNKRTTVTSERSSRYSEANSTNNNVRATQDSATVPPLNFEAPPEVNSVNTGSPVVSQYVSQVPTEGIAGTIERPVSPMSSVSGYSSGVPESINEIFGHPGENKPWGHDRAPNSIYQHNREDSAAAPQASGVSQQPQLAMAATTSDMSWLNLGDQNRK
ncbi:hypothetical protein PWT90_06921 [Aphanocladium album]|nr:hypothetical protein PWT90_06921 [Aphanocladium album]